MNEVLQEISVVVTTCERPDSVVRLVTELQECTPKPAAIVVVDSSSEPNARLEADPLVRYVRSSHRNQPYQRYVGALAVATPTLVYLDDDLFLTDRTFLRAIARAFDEPGVVGVGIPFEHENPIQPLFGEPRGCLAGLLVRLARRARRPLRPGEINAVGRTGGLPAAGGPTAYLRGGVMAYRTWVARQLFDPQLLALYEAGLGKGEDKIISSRATRHGRLVVLSETAFRHPPDLGSHYFESPDRFLRKVLASRLALAQNHAALLRRPSLSAGLAFLGAGVATVGNAVLRRGVSPVMALRSFAGAVGVVMRTHGLKPARLVPEVDFELDARQDLKAAGVHVCVLGQQHR